jgi:hypothetical protein
MARGLENYETSLKHRLSLRAFWATPTNFFVLMELARNSIFGCILFVVRHILPKENEWIISFASNKVRGSTPYAVRVDFGNTELDL